MIALAAAFLLSFAASLALESWPPSLAAFRAPPRATALRALAHLALFSAAFALSWRPWHAGFVVAAVALLFGLGSRMKLRILGEPVTFNDFALVRLAIRHPRLYYAEKLAEPRWIAIFSGLALATAAWFALERSTLSPGQPWLLVLPPAVAALAFGALRSEAAAAVARGVALTPGDPARDAARLGLGASLVVGWLAWRRKERPSAAARAAMASRPRGPKPAGAPVLVAIQCESFVDVAARGLPGPELASYRALAARSEAWGRCRVPAEGAYTMRSEFCFLTGLPPETLGLDALDPYLAARAYAPASLAVRLRAAGWRTVFIHPYDPRFFDRDVLAPALGFERFLDESAFRGAERFGPYISDRAVAEALAEEIRAAREPTFLFAVTIENHGPWGPGRVPGVEDPAEQYALHLRNSDAMIGRVAEALTVRPEGGALCVYGDHAPARTLHPDLPNRRATDYLVWSSQGATAHRAPEELPVEALGERLLALA